MDNRIKPVFDQIRAEDSLKQSTKAYLAQRLRKTNRNLGVSVLRPLTAVACALLLLGGRWLYQIPTVSISIDMEPSLELGINRFDRVVSVNAYNDDGQALLDRIQVINLAYEEAVDTILEEEAVEQLLSSGEVLVFSVAGPEGEQVDRVLTKMESCVQEKEQAHCGYAAPETVEQARASGLSVGKYRAFLEIVALDPSMTVEDIREMSMRQIHDLLHTLSTEDGEQTQPTTEPEPEQQGNVNGHGFGNGQGNGQGAGNGYHGGK